MAVTFTSREFNHDVSAAKRATSGGPVVITDRGRPSHVLLSYTDYRRLRGSSRNLADILRMGGGDEIEFSPGRVQMPVREVDL